MDGGDYRRRVIDLAYDLMELAMELKQDEYEEQQRYENVKTDGKIIYFPTDYDGKNKKTERKENNNASAFSVVENDNAKKDERNPDILEFTAKEISKMPKEFRRKFKVGHYKAHVQKRKYSYEIRLMINGKRISASNKVLEIAKKIFIEKLNELSEFNGYTQRKQVLFTDYMFQWLESTKKPYTKENTYKTYLQVFNVNIAPAFAKKKINEITPFDLQNFINGYIKAEKYRTAQKACQLLKAVFDFAVADELVNRSPMAKIKTCTYEKETGIGLTRLEEKKILDAFYSNTDNLYYQAFVFIMYTGLRRSELASATKDKKWITVTCAKIRKGRKEKKRKIPISPMLKKVIGKIELEKIKKLNLTVLSHEFKRLMPEHHLHELRHTFITRCQECGIPREFVSVWAGHAADQSITTKVYTHLEQYEDKQVEEISKFIYDF